ncbi:MAG: hypothetical protein HUJ42_01830 [Malacoplasma sp.]|nr:hypothetical protein [Malacoplasma sp.]
MKNKKSKLNLLLKIGICTGAFGLGATAITSCSFTNKGTMTFYYGSTKILENNNSPLGVGFSNSPITGYAASMLLGLTRYQTVNNFVFSAIDENGMPTDTKVDKTIQDVLTLEGARAVIIFANDSVQQAFNLHLNINLSDATAKNDVATNNKYLQDIKSLTVANSATDNMTSFSYPSSNTTTYTEGKDYWILLREKGGIEFQNGIKNTNSNMITNYYSNAINSGTVYQFLIDTQDKWVDTDRTVKQQLSGKDFERIMEVYTLAADVNYNRNGAYFLDLLGINLFKTAGYEDEKTKKQWGNDRNDLLDPNYDISNYVNANDNFFSLYINSPYLYTLSLLSKEYFNAVPHSNPKIQAINMYSDTPIAVTSNNTIDESKTDWSKIYGSGGLGVFTKDAWSAGAYYFSNFTSTVMELTLNQAYFDSIGKELLHWNNYNPGDLPPGYLDEDKIEKLVLFYGSGSTENYYDMFKSGQIDYATVPTIRQNEAAQMYGTNPNMFYPSKVVQTTQSNYIVYTPRPYIIDGNTIRRNDYIQDIAASFVGDWNGQNAITIRAAISGLINYSQLSFLNLTGSGDFQLSATPYGAFSNYYEAVAEDLTFGALPRKYSEYRNGQGNTLSDFSIPYYQYNSDGSIKIESIPINKQSFQDAIKSYGATIANPMNLTVKFNDGIFTNNYNAYLISLKQTIESLSGGLIQFNINQRNSPNPTANEWYNTQSSPVGFFQWMPDYNAVGTWIQADTVIQNQQVDFGGNQVNVEAMSGTNAHSAWLTFLSSMVSAVKLMDAKWTPDSANSGQGNYVVESLPTQEPFANDVRIKKAFDIFTKSESSGVSIADKLGIVATTRSSDAKGYTENDAANNDSNMTPGARYGLLAIGLLNRLINKGVFNQAAFDQYVKDPSKLNTSKNTPTSIDRLYIGEDVVNDGQSGNFSKWLGVYSGESVLKALYETSVIDSDYNFIIRSEAGLKEITYALKSPEYIIRNGTQQTNYRDYGINKNL